MPAACSRDPRLRLSLAFGRPRRGDGYRPRRRWQAAAAAARLQARGRVDRRSRRSFAALPAPGRRRRVVRVCGLAASAALRVLRRRRPCRAARLPPAVASRTQLAHVVHRELHEQPPLLAAARALGRPRGRQGARTAGEDRDPRRGAGSMIFTCFTLALPADAGARAAAESARSRSQFVQFEQHEHASSPSSASTRPRACAAPRAAAPRTRRPRHQAQLGGCCSPRRLLAVRRGVCVGAGLVGRRGELTAGRAP